MRIAFQAAILLLVASAAAADVQLYVHLEPLRPVASPGQTFDIDAYVSSSGADPERVTLTLTFPPELAVDDASGNPWTCSTAASVVRCSIGELRGSPPPIRITLTASSSLDGGRFAVQSQVDSIPSNGFLNQPLTIDIYRTFEVTTFDDDGAGSLRDAIVTANARCDGLVKCRIVFTKPMAIHPLTPLPAITACDLLVDAGRSDDVAAPRAVEISGARSTYGDGLQLRSPCGVTVQGLAIDGFGANGVVLASPPHLPFVGLLMITGCSIGTDSAAATARPNGLRGISIETTETHAYIRNSVVSGNNRSGIAAWSASAVEIAGCLIGAGKENRPLPNGASGVFLNGGETHIRGGLITANGDFGVAIGAGAAHVAIDSVVVGNGRQDIDYGLDGPTAIDAAGRMPPVPQLLSAAYDAVSNTTRVQLVVPPEGRSGYAHTVEFHSLVPDANGNTRIWIDGVPDRADVITSFLPGDHRGETIRALTQFRLAADLDLVATSEFSAPLTIPNAP